MPIQRIFWTSTGNQDIHVLRGHSTADLWSDRLTFSEATRTINAEGYFDEFFHRHADPDVRLTFQPLLKGTVTRHPLPDHDIFSGQGITVDMLTGRVTVAALAPSPPKNNFIMEVTATNTAGGPPMTETIRVHLHTSISSLALTPATLTVRPAAATRTDPDRTRYRFTLRAQFDDDTVGDLTSDHGVTWSSDPADHVDFDGELMIAPGDVAGGPQITIRATLPPQLGGGSATAMMRIAAPWSEEPTRPQASILAEGGWPGTTLPDRAPNVLFIGDGFQEDDTDSFEHIVNTMVHHLKTDRLLRPYDVLCTSMNFWRVFVPASARGISFRGEVYIVDEIGGITQVWPVPPPERPRADGDYALAHLVYAVGLPVPNDANKSVSDLRSDWDALVSLPPLDHPQPLPQGRIKDEVIEDWKQLATRGFIEELDNFPAMAFGYPPAANTDPGIPDIQLHPLRGGRNGLNRLCASMQSDNNVQVGPGARIGAVWAGRPPRRDNTAYTTGDVVTVVADAERLFVCTTQGTSAASEPADYRTVADGATVTDGTAVFRAARLTFNSNSLVVAVSSFPAGRALNDGQTIAVSTNTAIIDIPVEPRAVGFVLHLEDEDVPTDTTIDSCRTVAHELGHSFGLGDEYIEFDRAFPDAQVGFANLQTEPETHQFDPGRIKWNWHRIRKAAVIRDRIDEAGTGGFKIPVVPGQAWQFAKDDTVLLRFRSPGQFLGSAYVNPRGNATFYVQGDTITVATNAARLFVCTTAGTSAAAEPADYATATDGATVADGAAAFRAIPAVNPALQIAVAPSASASNDYLLVQPAAGVSVTLPQLQAFTPGSIVFLPVPAPESVRTPAYPYAEMVAKNVRDLIGRRHQPLYRQPTGSDLQKELKNERAKQEPKVDGLAPDLPGVFCFSDKYRIVGLYEGGHHAVRRIFHPTGACMMRDNHLESVEFCAVCRYVMVDLINPFHHFQIDLDYEDVYPLK
jgi:hypothetical protein